jgi:hypothetical protein
MALRITASAGETIDFDIEGDKGTVDILEGTSAEDLDLCRMIPIPEIARKKDGKMKQVQGTLLSIKFRDAKARETFAKGLKILQRQRADIEKALWEFPGKVFKHLEGNDDDTIRSRTPVLPPIVTFEELSLHSIVEIGDNDSIIREMR